MQSEYKFLSGDWALVADDVIKSGIKYDLILTSETIYSEANYAKLVNAIKSSLAPGGTVFLASKSHYFGVGGGTFLFEEFLDADGALSSQVCHQVDAPLVRQILKINWKSGVS